MTMMTLTLSSSRYKWLSSIYWRGLKIDPAGHLGHLKVHVCLFKCVEIEYCHVLQPQKQMTLVKKKKKKKR